MGSGRLPAGDYANSRYSPLSQLTRENVAKLQIKSVVQTGIPRGHEGQPLVVGTTMYAVTPFPNISDRARPDTRRSRSVDCSSRIPTGARSASHAATSSIAARATPTARSSTHCSMATWSRSTRRPASRSGARRSATSTSGETMTDGAARRRRTTSSSATPAASSACAARSSRSSQRRPRSLARRTTPVPTTK